MKYMTKALLVRPALIASCMLLRSLTSRATCSYYGFQTGRETRYVAYVGRMVKIDSTWLPRNEIRVMQ